MHAVQYESTNPSGISKLLRRKTFDWLPEDVHFVNEKDVLVTRRMYDELRCVCYGIWTSWRPKHVQSNRILDIEFRCEYDVFRVCVNVHPRNHSCILMGGFNAIQLWYNNILAIFAGKAQSHQLLIFILLLVNLLLPPLAFLCRRSKIHVSV